VLALALAFGVVGANAFADAAGFTAWDTDHPAGQFLRVLCGFVLFLLSWMLLRFLFRNFSKTPGRMASQLVGFSHEPADARHP
jgi:phosphotransferase system  glucose/maltose/N-acetylglucosamine-specific IIC component